MGNLDINSTDHLHTVRELLWKYGVVILPSNSGFKESPPLHSDESLVKLGSLFGTIESKSSVNDNVNGTAVQILETKGESGIPADSFIFQSDMSWRVNPTVAGVSCAFKIPPKGGNTCFQSANRMYERLDEKTRKEVQKLSFRHSLQHGYARSNRPSDVLEDHVSVQPGVIFHPKTRKPLLYVNRMFTTECVEKDGEDGAAFISKIIKDSYSEDDVLVHEWTALDVVIWDNLGIQHATHDDYEELRKMHRVVAANEHLRLERYFDACEREKSLELVEDILTAEDNKTAYNQAAMVYDYNVMQCGYRVPMLAMQVLAELMDDPKINSDIRILDLAAGTGMNAQLFSKLFAMRNIVAMDASDQMLKEAKRKQLYKEYKVANANVKWDIPDNSYDMAVCLGGMAPAQISAYPSIEELVRVVKSGGYLMISFQSQNMQYMSEVNRLITEKKAILVRNKTVTGITMRPDVQHSVVIAQVA